MGAADCERRRWEDNPGGERSRSAGWGRGSSPDRPGKIHCPERSQPRLRDRQAGDGPSVAAAAIGGDEQPGRVGVTRPPEIEPPLADVVYCEGGRVMVDADTHPPGIRGQIIDAIGHRSAEFLY